MVYSLFFVEIVFSGNAKTNNFSCSYMQIYIKFRGAPNSDFCLSRIFCRM